jgi:hypothetical protein
VGGNVIISNRAGVRFTEPVSYSTTATLSFVKDGKLVVGESGGVSFNSILKLGAGEYTGIGTKAASSSPVAKFTGNTGVLKLGAAGDGVRIGSASDGIELSAVGASALVTPKAGALDDADKTAGLTSQVIFSGSGAGQITIENGSAGKTGAMLWVGGSSEAASLTLKGGAVLNLGAKKDAAAGALIVGYAGGFVELAASSSIRTAGSGAYVGFRATGAAAAAGESVPAPTGFNVVRAGSVYTFTTKAAGSGEGDNAVLGNVQWDGIDVASPAHAAAVTAPTAEAASRARGRFVAGEDSGFALLGDNR